MPTPFTHLAIAQRLIDDPQIPDALRADLHAERGAFLLGNIAADARVDSGAARADTHFYHYGATIENAPWRVMLAENPSLQQPKDTAHRVFVAGYVVHLSVDEYWTTHFTHPYFGLKEWADRWEQFYMLHILLIHMDERDEAALESWQAAALGAATPCAWLPFLSDEALEGWRTLITDQIKPGGKSVTLNIFGERIQHSPEELRALADNAEEVQARLWDHIPRELLARIESEMADYAREQMIAYWAISAG